MKLDSIKLALRDPKRWKRWALEALILIVIVAGITTWQNSGLADGVAPPLAGTRTDGSTVKLGPDGTARLVVFWATWCKVCKAEAGNIEAIARDWPVITVAMQSGELKEIADFLEERGLKVPAIADDDSDIADLWGVRVVPAHFVVDGAGNIRFRVVGYTTKWGLRARLWWAQNIPA
jgi:thiol-disulfide isomerase/thioredoxin